MFPGTVVQFSYPYHHKYTVILFFFFLPEASFHICHKLQMLFQFGELWCFVRQLIPWLIVFIVQFGSFWQVFLFLYLVFSFPFKIRFHFSSICQCQAKNFFQVKHYDILLLVARKLKKIGQQKNPEEDHSVQDPAEVPHNISPKAGLNFSSQLFFLNILESIEPEVVNAGHDCGQPDSAVSLLTSLNELGERQLVKVVKWAKGLPGRIQKLHFLLEYKAF